MQYLAFLVALLCDHRLNVCCEVNRRVSLDFPFRSLLRIFLTSDHYQLFLSIESMYLDS